MAENVEQIRVEFVGDASKLEKASKDADAALDKTTNAVERSKSKWQTVVDAMTRFSPKFKGMSDDFNDMSDKMQDALGGIAKSSKLMKVAVVGAVMAVAAKAVQAMWKVMDNAANYFDSREWDKAQEALDVSKSKFTTAVGAFTSPIVNGAKRVFGGILDGLTWALKKIYAGFNLVYGIIKGLLTPAIEAVKSVIDAIGRVLSTVVEYIKRGLQSIAGLFGVQLFAGGTKAAEGMKESMDAAGESAQLATGALQGFDKLNTMDVTGDVGTSEEMKDTADEMQRIGEELGSIWADKFGNLFSMFDNIDLGSIWEKFTTAGGQAWERIKGFGQWAWNGLSSIGSTVWTTISGVASGVWQRIQTVGTTVWSVISGVATGIWQGLSGLATGVWQGIADVATGVWQGIQSTGTAVWDGISGVAKGIWKGIQTVATTVWETIQSVATTVWSIIGPPIETVWKTFQSVGEKAWAGLQKIGETFNRIVIDPIKSSVEWILEKVEWVLGKIGGIKDFLGGIGDKVGGAVSGAVNSVKGFLGLANGSVIEPNDPHLVMVGDNKREQEVVSPLSTIRQAVSEAISASGGVGSTGPINLVLEINGREFARATYDDIKSEGTRRGVTI